MAFVEGGLHKLSYMRPIIQFRHELHGFENLVISPFKLKESFKHNMSSHFLAQIK